MGHAKELLAVGFTSVIIVAAGLATGPSAATAAKATGAPATTTAEIRIESGHLLQKSGAELYGELCASCHGVDGAGNGPTARALALAAPPLNDLKRAGVPKRHWIYVLESPCDDGHHRAPSGAETMPCWQRSFRQALGNDAAALLVSTKLIDHLDSIQR